MKPQEFIDNHREALREILYLARISRERWNLLLFEAGIDFLKSEIPDEYGVSLISKEPMFWQWWKNIRMNRDIAWIELVHEGRWSPTLTSYLEYQERAIGANYPDHSIYQTKYMVLMKKMINHATADNI